MRNYQFIGLLLFLSLLWVPLIRTYTQTEQQKKFGGVERKVSWPTFSWVGLKEGSYQAGVEKWFAQNIGFRREFARTDNQLNFSLFGLMGSGMILGKNNFIFQSHYVNDLNGVFSMSEEKLAAFGRKLELLQTKLNERGVKFLLLLAPSKAYVYREYLPRHLLRQNAPATNYERLLPLLQDLKIEHLDSISMMNKLKAELEYPVFAPGGAHWSLQSACLVGQTFVTWMESALNRSIQPLSCEPIRESPARALDQDLSKLANLWSSRTIDPLMGYPVAERVKGGNYYRPKVLFVGDSFMWPLLWYLDGQKIFESRDVFYYYNTHHKYRHNQRPINKSLIQRNKLDWDWIFRRDAIVLELNQARINEEGFGFVDDALRELEG